jgi:hypothetical protein
MTQVSVTEYEISWTEKDATGHGALTVSLDLSALFNGSDETYVSNPFKGRPELAAQILKPFEDICTQGSLARKSARVMYLDYAQFHRFLDEMEHVAKAAGSKYSAPRDIREVPGETWGLFRRWLSASGHQRAHYIYFHVKRLFDSAAKLRLSAREFETWMLGPNPFPNPQKQRRGRIGRIEQEPDEEAIRALARVLEDQIDETERRFATAREILNEAMTTEKAGSVSTSAGRSNRVPAGYDLPLLAPAIREAYDLGVQLGWQTRRQGGGAKAAYQVVGHEKPLTPFRLAERFHAFVPMEEDVVCVFALFSMHTGWNFATTLDMLEDHWCRDHPTRPDLAVQLYSKKARAQTGRRKGKTQFAYSLKYKKFRPHDLILRAIRWTEPLRQQIRNEIAALEGRQSEAIASSAQVAADRARLDALKRRVRRVWLFLDKRGDINCLNEDRVSHNRWISHLIKENSIRLKDGSYLKFSQDLVRKSWAVFAYESSGYNLIITQIALGHSDLSSLLTYLDRKVIWNRNRRAWFNLQRNLLKVLRLGALNVKLLRKLVRGGELSAEEARLIRSGAPLTRQGVRCANPREPDPHVEPSHRRGDTCRGQNCMAGCSKAFVSFETAEFLARRILELRVLRDSMPLAAWVSSDYPHDLQFAERVLGEFSEENQRAAFAACSTKRHFVIPSVPSDAAIRTTNANERKTENR